MPELRLSAARVCFALAAGALAYLLSCLVEPPHRYPIVFGVEWARMSVQPFELVGPFPHRILGPLLAHLVGLEGVRYAWFSRLLSAVLLATVFAYCRQRGREPVDALLVALAVGICGAVQTFKGLVGYSDNLTYTLLLLGLMTARHGWLFWSLHLASLCNHELAFFFLPWLWFVRRQAGAGLAADVAGAVATSALYVGFRLLVGAHADNLEFTAGFFLDNHFLPWGTLALWVFAVIHLLTVFGPLLVVAIWHDSQPRPRRDRLHSALIAAGILGIYAVAYDVMRHTNIVFIPLVIASARFLGGRRARPVYVAILAASVVSDLLLGPEVLDRISDTAMECAVFPDYSRLLTCLLPRVWDQLLGCGLGIAVLVLVARRIRDAGVGGTP